MASEVSIKQSAADIKTISGRPGILTLIVPTLRNLRIKGTSTQESVPLKGFFFFFKFMNAAGQCMFVCPS